MKFFVLSNKVNIDMGSIVLYCLILVFPTICKAVSEVIVMLGLLTIAEQVVSILL